MQVLRQVQLENDVFSLFEKLFNEVPDFSFQIYILFYLLVQTYRETRHTLNHSESEIIKVLSIN